MRHSWLIIIALALIAGISACSTSNVGTVPAPDDSARNASFTVSQEEGLGTFNPRLDVEETAGQAIVRVYAEEAVDLQAAYLNIAYDGGSYSPSRVEFTDFVGRGEDVLSLAITDMRDVVPLGVAQIAGREHPVAGSGLLATVYFSATPFGKSRLTSAAPVNAQNSVDDLKIINQAAGSVTLAWTEKNVGDYDNNGEVSISDLTPIALLFGQQVGASSDPIWAQMVDGDGNGEINAADITPIGLNFGNTVAGYNVYSDEEGANPILEAGGCTCDRSNYFLSNKAPVEYVYIADSEGTSFTVRPVDSHDGDNAGVLSNVAIIVDVPGPPDAPTNLIAETGEQVGAMAIKLSWDASTHEDVAGYEIERKLGSEGDGSWAMIQQVGGGTLGYIDSDPTLTEEPYDYRVRAKDLTELLSDYSNVATATPWTPPPPSPPSNLTSTNEITTGNAIELNWDGPGDGSAIRFNIYCQGPGESEFSVIGSTPNASITSYLHTGLTEFETYEYYIKSVGLGGIESTESNTTSNTPSGASAIEITNLTTDKWTHYADGGDSTAATFTVETDIAPDSVEWNCTVGSVTGTGQTVTYKPPSGSDAQVVTVTCTVHKGTSEDSGTFKQYLTDNQIYTAGTGNGLYFEVTEYPSILNPDPPYMRFSSLFEGEGHVVIFTHWGTW